MSKWVLLLRGINVGGKNKLPMADLKSLLTAEGALDVHTYIQSGNAVFSSSNLKADLFSQHLSKAIENSYGFAPHCLLLNAKHFELAIQNCPFPKEDCSEKILHFYFLTEAPSEIDAKKLDDLKIPSEQWSLAGSVFYLYAPDGFGRSKLAAKAEKILSVPATVRNWRTVHKINDLLKD